MASNKWEILEAREVDETWEMNMHMNPIDEDMEETLKRQWLLRRTLLLMKIHVDCSNNFNFKTEN